MNTINRLLTSKRITALLLAGLVVNGLLLGVLFFNTRPAHGSLTGQGITLLPASLPVDQTTQRQVLAALAQAAPARGVWKYAITNIDKRAAYQLVSVAGFKLDQPEQWQLDNAVWLGTVTMVPGQAAGLVEDVIPPQQPAAPAPGAGVGGAGDILPFLKGTQAMYGVAGVHDCGFSLNGWKAVDLFPADGDVYASQGGEVSYVCRDDTQIAVRIGNHMYVHLVDNGIQQGAQFSQGQKLSSLVKGSFNKPCGYASQGANDAHIHFCFIDDGGNSYATDGYLLNLLSSNWTKGQETIGTMGFLTATWQDANNIPAPTSTVGGNFWDGIALGATTLANGAASKFPQHTAMGLAERIVNIAAVPLQLVYATILVNFNMRIVMWVFGIIVVLETIRLIYSGYMWIKRAIPVIG